MGADHTVRLVVPDGSQGGAPGGGLHAAGQKRHPHPKGSQHPVQAFGVLCGQDSVGASRAAWYPLRMQAQMAAAATRVLPLPTSPCSRRFMACCPLISAKTQSRRGAVLRWGQRGRLSQKGAGSIRRMGAPVSAAPRLFIQPMPELQHQQFLVDQAAAGGGSLFRAGGTMDGPHGIGFVRQTVFAAHLGGQRVCQQLRMGSSCWMQRAITVLESPSVCG